MTRLARSPAERTRPEDRRLKFYELRDMLMRPGGPLEFLVTSTGLTLVSLRFPDGHTKTLYDIPNAQNDQGWAFVPYAPKGVYRLYVGATGAWVGLGFRFYANAPASPLKRHYEGDIDEAFPVRVAKTTTFAVSGTCKCRSEAFAVNLYDFRGHGRTLIQTNVPYRGQSRVAAKRTRLVRAGTYIMRIKGDAYWRVEVLAKG